MSGLSTTRGEEVIEILCDWALQPDVSGTKVARLLNPDYGRKGTKDEVSRILLILD